MRVAVLGIVAGLVAGACGPTQGRRQPEPSVGPPADNECAVDIVNGHDYPLAVTLYSRSVNDLGVLGPSRSVRYAEECTARAWTVRAYPSAAPKPDPGDSPNAPTPVRPDLPSSVTRSVDVRPGVVVQVVL